MQSRFCSLNISSFSSLRLNLSPSNICAAGLLTVCLSLSFQPTDIDRYHIPIPWNFCIYYARMSSHLYQYMINLAVSLPIQKSPYVLVKISVWELCAIDKICILGAENCYFSTILLVFWCRISFQIDGLKISFLPNFELKFPFRIFISYLGILWIICSNST